ncbi:MAG: nucleotidyltransferase domain-containing protein [Chitinivibrionia bacterium]|nr:nucleotidyltransferase domain-containing protein [Chitinivibrionia bacterium]
MINASVSEIKIIKEIIKKHADDCRVFAFGSRVKSSAKKTSDLDLLFESQEKLGFLRIQKIKEAFQESDLPFRVDVIDYNDISENFKKIINEEKVRV